VEGLGLDQLIGIAQGGNPLQWALHDGMGSTAYMEAANGSITANYQYTPTGQTFLASGGLQGWPFLFTGRDIGLDQNYYNRNRYYDATLYRFMSPDPLSFGGGDTNLYAYVGNSPTNLSDPLGLSGGPASGDKPGPPPPMGQALEDRLGTPDETVQPVPTLSVADPNGGIGATTTPSPTAGGGIVKVNAIGDDEIWEPKIPWGNRPIQPWEFGQPPRRFRPGSPKVQKLFPEAPAVPLYLIDPVPIFLIPPGTFDKIKEQIEGGGGA
jgi:RHS repeat-associated protein